MITALLYIVVLAVVAGALFFLASAIFGRGEELDPLPRGLTLATLPAADLAGEDVRALRFQQVVRGYKTSEVDWALARLAAEIDRLRDLAGQGEGGSGQPE
ncbi:DivIVA domain-containing protein [Tomitella biformata]|uniref:DivIVA domain-containing protein n=1 Tax=Tomitella biformata TaxID=630403 RepID=UPI000467D44E|nr:DivIVA domain-containing protein [Tomitella biformata]